jgi:hypothetical protein
VFAESRQEDQLRPEEPMSEHRTKPKISFTTEDSIAVPAVTAVQMRELDRIAIEETGPSLYQMMENAGRTLAEFSLAKLGPSWQEAYILVLAGEGGNGGGGICAARHLANRGAHVQLCVSDADRLAEVTAFQRKLFEIAGGAELASSDLDNHLPSAGPDPRRASWIWIAICSSRNRGEIDQLDSTRRRNCGLARCAIRAGRDLW